MKIYLDSKFKEVANFSIDNHEIMQQIETKFFESDIEQVVAKDLENIYSKALSNGIKFYIRSPQQIAYLAKLIAKDFIENEETLRLSLTELMMNSLEHGNLKIDASTKNELIAEGTYYDMLYHLIESNSTKHIEVEYKLTDAKKITIKDQGEGFAYKDYLSKHDMNKNDNYSGRGIQIAKAELPKNNANLTYLDNGSIIVIDFI